MTHPGDLSTLHGTFPGSETSSERLEILMHAHWPIAERQAEAKLYARKWWDYRFAHPVMATYLFAHLLNVEARRIIRTHINPAPPREAISGKIVDWEVLRGSDPFDAPLNERLLKSWQTRFRCILRMRQQADMDGIPYDVWVQAALHHHYLGKGSYLRRGATPLPVLTALRTDACLLDVRVSWLEELKRSVREAEHPVWRDGSRSPSEQASYGKWLLQVLGVRARPERALARLVATGHIPGLLAIEFLKAPGRDVSLFRERLTVELAQARDKSSGSQNRSCV